MIDPIDQLELAGLRSGRDEYSKMKLPALTKLKPVEAAQIAEELPVPADQAALRWVLRGQTVEKAVAKVILDREMVERLRDKRRTEKTIREMFRND